MIDTNDDDEWIINILSDSKIKFNGVEPNK